MPRLQAAAVNLSDRQRKILESFKKGTHTPLHFIERATIVLLAAEEIPNKQIARQTGLDRNKVKLWRIRWSMASAETAKVEAERPHALKGHMQSILSDEQRSGAPATFTPEQVAHIIAIACQSPKDYDVPISHWTPSELARQAVKQGIVERISSRQVGRFLKRYGLETSS